MLCPLCRERSARRACPARGARICPLCCGSKRLTEIACPPGCAYLASARTHPAAVVRRQQERDGVWIARLTEGLNERQESLCWTLVQAVLAFHDPLVSPADTDLAEAAGALARTFETSGKGLIYEHRAGSLVGQRLAAEIRGVLKAAGIESSRALERDAVAVLRQIERTALEAGRAPDATPTALLEVLRRLADLVARDARAGEPLGRLEAPTTGLIIP